MKKLAVVAFGGNALMRGDQKGTIDEQEANAYQACEDDQADRSELQYCSYSRQRAPSGKYFTGKHSR